VISSLLLGSAIEWTSWSNALFSRAQERDRAVFVATGSGEPVAVLEEGPAADVLKAHFVTARVDPDERPDVVELVRLTWSVVSDSPAPPEGTPLWAAFTPSLHPLAAGVLTDISPEALAARLSSLALALQERRGEVEAAAGVAAARVVASQSPEPPQGPLDRAVLDRALRRAIEAGDAVPTPGGIRLLLAEAAADGAGSLRKQVSARLLRLAATPEPGDLAGRAMRLRALVEGYAATGTESLAVESQNLASRLAGGPRDEDGAFLESAGGRAFAYQNGLAIGALAVSSSTLGRVGDSIAAARAAATVLAILGPWKSLSRCAGGASSCGPAFLEDYAFLTEGLLDLYDATGEARWRDAAREGVDAALARFLDSAGGGFFETDAAHAPLPARLKSPYDGARPSANGVMATVLLRLSRASGEKRYADIGRDTVNAFRGDLQRAPRGVETLAAAAESWTSPQVLQTQQVPQPARETRGGVEVEAAPSRRLVRPGDGFEVRIRFKAAASWAINGHRPPLDDLVGLSVSVPGTHFVVGAVRYPTCAACPGETEVVVPLRVPLGAQEGDAAVRLSTRFQPCRSSECLAPETIVLDVPLKVESRGR